MRSILRTGDADMTEGKVWQQLLRFSIPTALGLLFQQLYNTVDTLVVGRFVGKTALAAVGSVGSIINMLVGFSAGMSLGASVVISQRYGAHDDKGLHRAVQTTVALTLVLCAAATAAGILLVGPMLRMMQTPADVMEDAGTYLRIYFSGLTGLLLYNMGASVLRAVGDSVRPLGFLIFSALTNIVFDLVFVVVLRNGVAGVAVATVLSQSLSALLVLVLLTREPAAYGIRWRRLCLDREALRQMASVGIPSGLQQAVTSFSNVFVQSYVNFFGSACMAGWSAYAKVDAFVLIPLQSIGMASTTFVGQNYGAKKTGRARQGVRQSILLSLAVTLTFSGIVMLLASPLMRLFSSDDEVIAYGVRFILTISPLYSVCTFTTILSGALRGVGIAKTPTVIMLGSYVLFRQLYLFTVKALGNNLTLISVAYPVGWILCSILLSLVYRRSVLVRGAPEGADPRG